MPGATLTLTARLRPSALDSRRGVVRLHPEVLAALGGSSWAVLRLVGRRTTGALAALAEPGTPHSLLLCDDLTLGNLGLRDGGQVTVSVIPARAAHTVAVAGPPEVAAVITPENLRLVLLGKVLSDGDNVSLLPQDFSLPAGADGGQLRAAQSAVRNAVGTGWTSLLLTVTSADPAETAVVAMDTVVGWRDGTSTSGSATPDLGHPTDDATPTLADLPGLESQAAELKEWLDLGFHHRDLLEQLGTQARMGALVSGPAGSGKSSLVRAVAAEVKASVVHVWAPEIATLAADPAARRLRDALDEAKRRAPAVLMIEDVDALAPRDDAAPIATVLLEVLRSASNAPGVAAICTTSRPESVQAALRHPGVLDHEVNIPLPDRAQRLALLGVLTRPMPLAPDVVLDEVAARTPGFVAADLLSLAREAGVRAAIRQRDAANPTVAQADLVGALDSVHPTAMAESTLDIAGVTLDDVGDMAEVKRALTETLLWPLSYPDTFARLGVKPPRGVLLYGPPGCGKTFLVRALAGSGQANVLTVKGAELLSKWVGESERAVRELFRRARDAAPAMVFLDEIDALAPVRGQSTDGGTTDRVVASLLTELDGVEELRNVVVIGATNRPDLIDPALLRPGRLERLVYVPPPDADARAEILKAAAKHTPLADDVDLVALAGDTEGYSAADCAALIREAALVAMRESLEAPQVTAAHLAAARGSVRPSLDPVQVAALAAYAAAR
ncbi:MAG: AAA family ATPase [Mycobacteriales bacterium]